MARALPVLVAAYGAIVAAGGVYGYATKGSVPSLAAGGGLGLATFVAGLAMRGGRRGARGAALVFVAAIVVAMGERFARTHGVVPAVPVIVLGLPLVVLLARSLRGGGAPAATPPAPRR